METEKRAFEYALNLFSRHADQRLRTFNFYIILTGAFVAAYLTSISISQNYAAVIVSIFLIGFSILFWRLDIRNSELAKLSERYLKEEEFRMSKKVGKNILIITDADKHDSPYSSDVMKGYLNSYGSIFKSFFIIILLLSCIGIIYAVFTELFVVAALTGGK